MIYRVPRNTGGSTGVDCRHRLGSVPPGNFSQGYLSGRLAGRLAGDNSFRENGDLCRHSSRACRRRPAWAMPQRVPRRVRPRVEGASTTTQSRQTRNEPGERCLDWDPRTDHSGSMGGAGLGVERTEHGPSPLTRSAVG